MRFARNQVFLCKSEVTEQTDSVPTGMANAIQAIEASVTPFNNTPVTPPVVQPYMGAQKTIPTRLWTGVELKTFMQSGAAPGATAPAWGPLHTSCPVAQTLYTGAAGTIATSPPVGVDSPAGTFTYAKTAAYTGTRARTATLVCTTLGGSGVAEFTVTAPAAGNLGAYNQTGVVMTDATPFAIGGGATVTPTVGTAFEVGDEFTIELKPARAEYTPISTGFKSSTIYYNDDGVLHAALGCRGNLGWSIENGIPYWTYQMAGVFVAPTAVALPAVDMSNWQDPTLVDRTSVTEATLHGVAVKFATFTGTFGVDATPRFLANHEDVPITDWMLKGQMRVEAEALGTVNWFEIARNQALGALAYEHGTVAGKIMRIEADRVQVTNVRPATDKGIRYYDLELSFIPSGVGGDDVAFIAA